VALKGAARACGISRLPIAVTLPNIPLYSPAARACPNRVYGCREPRVDAIGRLPAPTGNATFDAT
jgi:hypothetical protein